VGNVEYNFFFSLSVEQSVEWELAGETEVLGGNLPQRHFVFLFIVGGVGLSP
jgi:hypothetical protein